MSSTFGRVLLFRHLAICVSALMAYVLRQELRVGYAVLAVVAGSAILNFALYLLRTSRRTEPVARLASPVIGIAAWTALIVVTGGVGSPFVAGLWLEIMLAAMVFSPRAVLVVSAAAATAHLLQQWWLGLAQRELALALEIGFLFGMGGLTFAFNRRSERRERALEQEQQRLGEHLGRLEIELADERVLGQLGENVGRLAHGLKNSVHSLRGFAALLEPSVGERGHRALAGLRTAIDDLESLARVTLEERAAIRKAQSLAAGSDTRRVLERAVAEVTSTHPEVEWRVDLERDLPLLDIDDDDLEEVLLILLRNGIEAMSGRGIGRLAAGAEDGVFWLTVRDHGPGIPSDDLEGIFRAGYTTKTEGSGYGLFLARRVVTERGGELVTAPSGAGATFRVTLPLARSRVD